MADTEILAPVTDEDLRRGGLPENVKMAPGLAIYFVDSLYQRCKAVALRMSEARGMVGPHLLNNPGACMAIISRSITWNLDPFAVAQSTYAVKEKIGYEGKLCQAILENSGSIEGKLKFEFFGDWDKLRGKFKMTGAVGSGERKPQQLWTDDDEVGLGVKVSAQVKGETERREEEFFLAEMHPRNSTLWILRPKQQMRYATARAFGNLAVPGIFMGIPFDVDPAGLADMHEINPRRPVAENEFRSAARSPDMGDWITRANFAETLEDVARLREEGLKSLPADPPELRKQFEEVCDARARQIAAKVPNSLVALANGQSVQEPGDKTEEAGPDKEAEADQPKVNVEPPFKRGQRLLALCTVPNDVFELWLSISEELSKKKDLDLWRATCEARWKEVGGTGKMPTKAAK